MNILFRKVLLSFIILLQLAYSYAQNNAADREEFSKTGIDFSCKPVVRQAAWRSPGDKPTPLENACSDHGTIC